MIDGQKLTYAQFKDRKRRREISHPVVTDDDAVTAYKVAAERLRLGRARNDKAEVTAATKAMAEAEASIRASTIVMRLRALPRKGDNSYTALKAQHTPLPGDDEKLRELTGDDKSKAQFHADTFGPVLVAACLIEPEVTEAEAAEMAEDMNDAEWDALFYAAIQVNTQQTDTAGLVFS